ncbi:MAG: putative hydrolase of the HAD superfamily [Sphingobacteriales bacterium]|jgi:putative hydrolase of the HAD superfamily
MRLPSLILFDWDDTLWDFQKNSDETILELAKKYKLPVGTADLLSTYHEVNTYLWGQYQKHVLSQAEFRQKRFRAFFESLDLLGMYDQSTISQFSSDYIEACPQKNNLIPGAKGVLNTLQSMGIRVSVATNGFHEVQEIKVRHSGLSPLLSTIHSPKSTGFRKPNPAYFKAICDSEAVKMQDVWMVGDELHTDAKAADEVGVKGIWYNPAGHKKGQFKNEISELPQLLEMFN